MSARITHADVVRKQAAMAVLHHITTLGGNLEHSLVHDLASASHRSMSMDDRPLTVKGHRAMASIVSLAEGLLGETLVEEIRRELADTTNVTAKARLELALSYLEEPDDRVA